MKNLTTQEIIGLIIGVISLIVGIISLIGTNYSIYFAKSLIKNQIQSVLKEFYTYIKLLLDNDKYLKIINSRGDYFDIPFNNFNILYPKLNVNEKLLNKNDNELIKNLNDYYWKTFYCRHSLNVSNELIAECKKDLLNEIERKCNVIYYGVKLPPLIIILHKVNFYQCCEINPDKRVYEKAAFLNQFLNKKSIDVKYYTEENVTNSELNIMNANCDNNINEILSYLIYFINDVEIVLNKEMYGDYPNSIISSLHNYDYELKNKDKTINEYNIECKNIVNNIINNKLYKNLK